MAVFANTLLVTSYNNAGPGSLREQIASSSAGDTIRISPSLLTPVGDTIFLDTTITIEHNLVIIGAYTSSDTVVISGQGLTRVFYANFSGASNSFLWIDSLYVTDTYTNGPINSIISHGAIRADSIEQVVVANSVFTNNMSTGLGNCFYFFNCGSARVKNCSFRDNLGTVRGVMSAMGSTQLFIEDCSFINNSTDGSGGAFQSFNKLEVRRTDFIGNISLGGSLMINSRSNGMSHPTIIDECTFINNSTQGDGGVIRISALANIDTAELIINKVTAINNSAGDEGGFIYFKFLYSYINTPDHYVRIEIDSSTIIGGQAPAMSVLSFITQMADDLHVDFKMSHCEIDSNLTAFTTSASNVIQLHCDAVSTTTNPADFTVSIEHCNFHGNINANELYQNGGLIFVQAPIIYANFQSSTFSDNMLAGMLHSDNHLELDVNDCSFSGNGKGAFQIIGNEQRLLDIRNSIFSGHTSSAIYIWGGNSTNQSLVIGESYFSNCIFENNQSLEGGAVADHSTGYVEITFDSGSVIDNNQSTWRGGGVYVDDSEFAVVSFLNGSEITENQAGHEGGGISVTADKAYLILENSTMSLNSSEMDGGGIYLNVAGDSGIVLIKDCSIEGNYAAMDGGVVFNYSGHGKTTFDGGIISANFAENDGGVVRAFVSQDGYGRVYFKNGSLVSDNGCGENGGVIAGPTRVKCFASNDCSFLNNSAVLSGGVAFAPYIHFADALIQGNSAGRGGGFSYSAVGNVFLERCNVRQNTSLMGVYTYIGCGVSYCRNLQVDDSWIDYNSSDGYGGAFWCDSLNVMGSTMSNNSSELRGGVVYLPTNCYVNIESSTFYKNHSDVFGGAICIRPFGTGSGSTMPNIDLSIVNTTFYKNTSSTLGKDVHLYSSWTSGNIDLYLEGNLFAGTVSNQWYASPGSINSGGYNTFTSNLGNTVSTDVKGINLSNLFLDDTLSFNGGFAPTLLPQQWSPVINTGNPTNGNDAQNGPIYLIRDRGAAETGICESVHLLNINDCDSVQLYMNGPVYTSSGYYVDSLTNGQGCDSVLLLNIDLGFTVYDTTVAVDCDGIYTWPFNGQVYNQAGDYLDTTIQSNGCMAYGWLELSFTDIDTALVCGSSNGQTVLTALDTTADAYQWLDCNGMVSLPGDTFRVFSPSVPGNYAALISKNGCVEISDCFYVHSIGIDYYETSDLRIFPNPAHEFVNISATNVPFDHIIIRNALGQEVFATESNIGMGATIDVSAMVTGVYTLQVIQEERILKQWKLVIADL